METKLPPLHHLFKLLMTLVVLSVNPLAAEAEDSVIEIDAVRYSLTSSDDDPTTWVVAGGNPVGSVTVPAEIVHTSTGIAYPVSKVRFGAFKNKQGLTGIVFEGSITISQSAFEGCSNLESVVCLGENAVVDNYAFKDCSKLRTIAIPAISVSEDFSGCPSLDEVIIHDGTATVRIHDFTSCTAKKLYLGRSFGKSTCSWKGASFEYLQNISGMPDLATLTIGPLVDELKTGVDINKNKVTDFSNCPNLTSLTLLPGDTPLNIAYGVFEASPIVELNLGRNVESCFLHHPAALRILTIGDGVTDIHGGLFDGCNNLKEFVMGRNVREIGDNAFYGCAKLSVITSLNPEPPACGRNIFGGVDKVKCIVRVPAGCVRAYRMKPGWTEFDNIVEIDSEESVTATMDGVTYSVGLTGEATVTACDPDATEFVIHATVTIAPAGGAPHAVGMQHKVTTVAPDAFKRCHNLTRLTVEPTLPPVCLNQCFEPETFQNCTLLVPGAAINTYKAMSVWSSFANIETIESAGVGEVEPDATVPVVTYRDGRLCLGDADGTPVSVYNLHGAKVCDGVTVDGTVAFRPSASGMYVVLSGGRAHKIFVRI